MPSNGRRSPSVFRGGGNMAKARKIWHKSPDLSSAAAIFRTKKTSSETTGHKHIGFVSPTSSSELFQYDNLDHTMALIGSPYSMTAWR
uniref:Uncharacterized protein n=1 Tax=Melanopsichium pennsylvanicum 4 TaxID=1398559 RepID=A0A077R6M2_9BASI|nr:uncharacterized protein BN887_06173 [Melanopsichium pennsylvanicum 4]